MSDPYWRMFGREWDDGTAALSLEEEAALLRICNAINSRRAPLPDDDEGDREMMHRCRVSMRKWKSLKSALLKAGKITIEDGAICQARALSEVGHRIEQEEENAENGAKGARKRAENRAKTARKPAEIDDPSNENNDIGSAYPEPYHIDSSLPAHDGNSDRPDLASSIRQLLEVAGPGLADPAKEPGLSLSGAEVGRWLQAGCDFQRDIVPVIAAKTMQPRASPITTWTYFRKAVLEASSRNREALSIPETPDDQPASNSQERPRQAYRPSTRRRGGYSVAEACAGMLADLSDDDDVPTG